MNDFTSGNAARQILMFSLPMLIGNMFQQLYSMVDAIVVGRFVGGTALASVGVAMNVLQFLLAVLIGLTTGASVVIAQYYGAKQYDNLERAVSTSILFLAVFSVVITAVGIFCAPAILRALNTSADILDDARLYLRVLMAGIIFPIFFNMYTAYLRALGDSRSPLYFLIISTVLNTGLDLLLVVRFGLGVFGVAIATIIAQAVAAVLCYIYTRRTVPLLTVKGFVYDRRMFGAILRYGTPAALQLSLVSLANLTITRLINSFGSVAMAGVTAAVKFDQLATLPISNFSMALSTFVGQNMGAGLIERVRRGFRSSVLYMVALAICLSLIVRLLGPHLLALFLNREDVNTLEIMGIGLRYLNVISAFYFLFSLLFSFNGFFRGVGDGVVAMIFPVSSLVIRTLSAYALVWWGGMGPEALAWSIPIGWGLSSLASWLYYLTGRWTGKAVTKAAEPAG
ncbi:MAG: MATE family efflux transporter [Oscillospiraceae bacterium]|jgi:putative MATE family efflux protein|nr:MATE family efflux transporter [Oscillospiraceae bacterium]